MIEEAQAGDERETRAEPAREVEDNGHWFAVAVAVLTTLFIAGVAAVVHSLAATFG